MVISVSSVVRKITGAQARSNEGASTSLKEVALPPFAQRSSRGFVPQSLAALAILGSLLAAGGADAANNPKREKAVADLAAKKWTELKGQLDQIEKGKNPDELLTFNNLWNDLQAIFHVTDNTKVEAIEPIRVEVIIKGATNPHIPPAVVHGALYTMAVEARELNKEINAAKKANDTALVEKLEARKAKMTEYAIPYLGKIIVDTTTKEGKRERHLVPPSSAQFFLSIDQFTGERPYPVVDIYEGKDFEKLASYVIAQVAEQATLDKVAQELLNVGNDESRRNEFFDIFYHLSSDTPLPANIREKSKEWIFGKPVALPSFPLYGPPPPGNKPSLQAGEAPPSQPPQQPPNTPIQNPGNPAQPLLPKQGSLDALKEIDPKLITPKLPYHFGKSEAEQIFIAKNILMLAEHNDELALPAASQWFALKTYGSGAPKSWRELKEVDYMILQALAKSAQKDKVGFEVLKRVVASYPTLCTEALFTGAWDTFDSPVKRAGVEVIKALSTDKEASRGLLTAMANKSAKLIWPEPSFEADLKTVNTIRDLARDNALETMAFLDNGNNFVSIFRDLLKNPFVKDNDRFISILGLAFAKDKESIDKLVAIGADERYDISTRSLAIQAALHIDRPDVVPESIRKRAREESPFSAGKLSYFFPNAQLRGKKQERMSIHEMIQGKNPFQNVIAHKYSEWLKAQEAMNKARVAKGGEPITIRDTDKLQTVIALVDKEFGGSEELLSGRARDESFKNAYLLPMVKYLERGKDKKSQIDTFIAFPMMRLLSKANCEEAAPIFANMAINPEQYVQFDGGDFGFFGLLFKFVNTALIKAEAIKNLGGVASLADLNDPNAAILFRLAKKESSLFYRFRALSALDTYADRYNDLINGIWAQDIESTKRRQGLIKTRNAHGEKVLDIMKYHSKNPDRYGQMRLFDLFYEFTHARLADKFGMREKLLRMADSAAKKDCGDQIIRSIVHALISNGFTQEDIKSLHLDTARELYNYVSKEDYSLGGKASELEKYTGKGLETAVLDVGYAYPVSLYPDLEKRIIYPERLVKFSDLTDIVGIHPTAVSTTIHKKVPKANIHSYSLLASIPEVPFRPYETQATAYFAYEDIAELMLEDKANIEAINESWGYWNIILYDEKLRNLFIDQLSAVMEVLGAMDVKHTVASANEFGDVFSQYPSIGELNSLGLRFDKKGNPTQPDNVIHASAMDAFPNPKRLAEFSSTTNPLRVLESIKLLSFQGVNVMAPWVENNKWVNAPLDGTSFAAPNANALIIKGTDIRRTAGLKPLSLKEWRALLNKCTKTLPDREAYEGGNYLDATLFLRELLKP